MLLSWISISLIAKTEPSQITIGNAFGPIQPIVLRDKRTKCLCPVPAASNWSQWPSSSLSKVKKSWC